MVIQIDNYDSIPRIVSLAKELDTAKLLQEKGLNYVFVDDNFLFFSQNQYEAEITQDTRERFIKCNNFDIFQIDERGLAYRSFDCSSADNGIIVTMQCNSNCLMCPMPDSQRRDNLSYSIGEAIETIRHMPLDTEHLTVTGGEPFLKAEMLFQIMSLLKRQLPYTRYLLLTNGRALSYKPFAELLCKSVPEQTIVGIPLHGYNAATHDSITRSPGGFNQTVQGIKNAIEFGFKVELRIVVSKLNMCYVTKIAELIVKELKGVFRVQIMGLEMLGNAAKNEAEVWIPYKTAFNVSKKAIDLLAAAAIPVGLYNFPLCAVDKGYRFLATKSISDYKVKFADACDRCTIKDACGGFFRGSFRLAKNDAIPVR